MRITHRIAAAGATVALSSALAIGATGTASASTASAAPAAAGGTTVSTPVELAACHRVWHPGAWYWFDRGSWDRFHRWQHHREHRQYPGRWDCR